MKAQMNKNLVGLDVTIKDVLLTLNTSPIGIVFFIDRDNKLKGIMTDGDVRRVILQGTPITEPASQFMVRDFVFGRPGRSQADNIKLLNNRIRHLPILDDQGEMVDFLSIPGLNRLPVMEPLLDGNELSYVVDCINTNWISSQGVYVGKFETQFAQYQGIDCAVTTSNGTTALHLALTALGVGAGDEVIVPDFTFGACANAVIHCGAMPVFVDISPDYWNMNPALIEAAVTPKTKAIMAVHLYGHPCDMDPILEIGQRHHLYVVEDCAEALGASYKGRSVGTIGDVGCFSFFSNKIITTGEGGMVITRDQGLYEKMMVLRDHGMQKGRRYRHEVVGFNYRMTNIQAAIGLAQLEKIDRILARRRFIEQEYERSLQGCEEIVLPPKMPWAKNVCWLFSIIINEKEIGISRDSFMLELHREGIDSRPFFYPLHEQPAFEVRGAGGSFPVTQDISGRGISLPTSNQLTAEEIETVCTVIKRIVCNHREVSKTCINMLE